MQRTYPPSNRNNINRTAWIVHNHHGHHLQNHSTSHHDYMITTTTTTIINIIISNSSSTTTTTTMTIILLLIITIIAIVILITSIRIPVAVVGRRYLPPGGAGWCLATSACHHEDEEVHPKTPQGGVSSTTEQTSGQENVIDVPGLGVTNSLVSSRIYPWTVYPFVTMHSLGNRAIHGVWMEPVAHQMEWNDGFEMICPLWSCS